MFWQKVALQWGMEIQGGFGNDIYDVKDTFMNNVVIINVVSNYDTSTQRSKRIWTYFTPSALLPV